jgi:hypothetical protein
MQTEKIIGLVFLVILFGVLYAWSNYIFKNPFPNVEYTPKIIDSSTFYDNNQIISHKQSNGHLYDVIFNSGVCKLGRIVFYLWLVFLLIALPVKYYSDDYRISQAINGLAVITIIVTLIMNYPLFIRSIPAFACLLLIANYDLIG